MGFRAYRVWGVWGLGFSSSEGPESPAESPWVSLGGHRDATCRSYPKCRVHKRIIPPIDEYK